MKIGEKYWMAPCDPEWRSPYRVALAESCDDVLGIILVYSKKGKEWANTDHLFDTREKAARYMMKKMKKEICRLHKRADVLTGKLLMFRARNWRQ